MYILVTSSIIIVKYPFPPQGRSMKIPRGRGVLKAKFLKGKYEGKLEYPGGWGGGFKPKNPSMGGREYGYYLEPHIVDMESDINQVDLPEFVSF